MELIKNNLQIFLLGNLLFKIFCIVYRYIIWGSFLCIKILTLMNNTNTIIIYWYITYSIDIIQKVLKNKMDQNNDTIEGKEGEEPSQG